MAIRISDATRERVLAAARSQPPAVETDIGVWRQEQARKARAREEALNAQLALVPPGSTLALQRMQRVNSRKPWLPPPPPKTVPVAAVRRQQRAAELDAVLGGVDGAGGCHERSNRELALADFVRSSLGKTQAVQGSAPPAAR
jgi:hypothetical protein